jgi:hypothetical protein
MYGPPRPCKVFGHDNGDRCVNVSWPLASGLLLQPGHDEIRACRSQITVRARGRAYDTPIGCLVILLEPRNLWGGLLSERRVAPLIDGTRAGQYYPRNGVRP